jgi:hypothetical protein
MRRVLLALLVLAILSLPIPLAHATGEVTIDATYPIQATLNGSPYLISGPASGIFGTLCLPQLIYQNSFARYSFAGWYSNGTLSSTDTCASLTGTAILAHYNQQYRVTVVYTPQNQVANSTWVNAGTLDELSVPAWINGSQYRYQLQGVVVSGAPVFAPGGLLSVSANEPLVVQAEYQTYVALTIALPSKNTTVWVVQGQPWYRIFPQVLQDTSGTSLRLDGFDVFGTSQYAASGNVMTATPSSPMMIRPLYDTYYYVVVNGPEGYLARDWYRNGSLVNVTAPAVIQINDQKQLEFTGWTGVTSGNVLSFVASKPQQYTANYATEFSVLQNSPLGSSTRFIMQGNSTAMFFPTTLPATLGLTRTLESVLVNGAPIFSHQGIVAITVNGPTEVTAVYTYGPDYIFIGFVAAALVAITLIYFAQGRRRRPKSGSFH